MDAGSTGATDTHETNNNEALLVEYQVCNNIIQSASNRCWLAGSLFIGAAFAALAVLLTSKQQLDPLIPALGSIAATLALMGLKRFLINEEWRNRACYSRMRKIERTDQINMQIIRAIDNRTSPGRLRWTRFPWTNEFEQHNAESTDSGVTNLSIRCRQSFGWELLRWSIWLAIAAWLVYGFVYWFDYFRPDLSDWARWLPLIILIVSLVLAGFGKLLFGDWRAKEDKKKDAKQTSG